MSVFHPSHRASLALGSLLCVFVLGCSRSESQTPQSKDLASLRQAVSGLHELSAAQKAGYTVAVGHPTDGHTCLSDVSGAMGVHYLNSTLVDSTVVVTKPQLMIYEPQRDGSTKFVGVEYIIPFKIRSATRQPPVLFGQSFQKDETFQLWALHAWIGRSNPSGMFAMWNPEVSCQYAH
jgi:hypothetical protein